MICLLLLLVWATDFAKADEPLPGKTSEWSGFSRYDFDQDGRSVTVVAPTWLWRGEFFGAFPEVDLALLKSGYHVGYLQPILRLTGADQSRQSKVAQRTFRPV